MGKKPESQLSNTGLLPRKLRFRQIHLDFHTSPDIGGIGEKFNRKEYQETLKDAAVDSITTFALCHHGYSYYDTKVGIKHPHLKFDLLKAQFDACKEIDVNVPIYLTFGANWLMGGLHPEWNENNFEGRSCDPLWPGFRKMCFNSPYLDHICEQIREVVKLYPSCDGIFLDIISQGQCCCVTCMKSMAENGFDPRKEADRKKHAQMVLMNYYRKTTEAAKAFDKNMPIFHNSGHVSPAYREKLKYFSHLELESLPTGGWGYDHFPMVAKYCSNLKFDFLGMTGKFHTTWGEFGGYKHPDALRYECASMLAVGAKCSIGDQLHPSGRLDSTTYRIIGEAYREVEAKEPWCDNVENASDIGLYSVEGANDVEAQNHPSDIGASRLLLEGHFLFDIIDSDMDVSKYKMIILPDDVNAGPALKKKIDAYLKNGGKMLLTGVSGLDTERKSFLWDVGAEYCGLSEFRPDYVLPSEELRSEFLDSPVVMYFRSHRIKVKKGVKSCGRIYDPYFNREYSHFCSHQHTPYKLEDSGFDSGSVKGNIMYLAHPVFENYRWYGASVYRDYMVNAIREMLGDDIGLKSSLPPQARVTLMEQASEKRYVLHLLYANKIVRGGSNSNPGDFIRPCNSVEIIEGLDPLFGTSVSLKLDRKIKKVTLEPQGMDIGFSESDGRVNINIGKFACHQMLVCHY
ncbi:MAG: alpha-amylase family protein [Victivallales bacterium]